MSPVSRCGIIGVSVVLFLFGCGLPCLQAENGIWFGFLILAVGWFGILFGQFAWLANIIYLPSLVCVGLGWWRVALGLTLLQGLIALNMLSMPGTVLPRNEAGDNVLCQTLLPGAWVWFMALLIPGISLFFAKRLLPTRP